MIHEGGNEGRDGMDGWREGMKGWREGGREGGREGSKEPTVSPCRSELSMATGRSFAKVLGERCRRADRGGLRGTPSDDALFTEDEGEGEDLCVYCVWQTHTQRYLPCISVCVHAYVCVSD